MYTHVKTPHIMDDTIKANREVMDQHYAARHAVIILDENGMFVDYETTGTEAECEQYIKDYLPKLKTFTLAVIDLREQQYFGKKSFSPL